MARIVGAHPRRIGKEYAMFTRTGRTAALAALTGCTAALAVGGCQVDTGQLQHQAHTYAVSSPVHTLVINDRVGDVHVTGGAGQVSVTERISYRHQLPATTHAVRAGTLTLTGTCPVHQPATSSTTSGYHQPPWSGSMTRSATSGSRL